MSLIEKAVERLDKLKQAGVEVPEVAPRKTAKVAAPESAPVTAALVEEPAAEHGSSDVQAAPAAEHGSADVQAAPAAEERAEADTAIAPKPVPKPAARGDRSGAGYVEIDLERLASIGMVTPDQPRSPVAEEYRLIKRPVLSNAQGGGAGVVEDGNLIMVTSSLPGEGKSFTTINLAISMAVELDYTVLLVDADVSKPSVLNILGLPPARGLMDVLVEPETDLGDVLLRTNIEKLTILPAGMAQSNATELLASDSMNRLLDEISSRYKDRVIVFDSPPLLVTTEARALASHMGQIIMVVEANRTTQAVVQQALSTIERCPVKMMLLNKAEEGHASGYGYGYG